ncbi:hypothetical protein, conserved [Leishmania tarentolae]|uniref:Uncharacterized protein n=1 Tax=Leishmania tarentolae TaxID=5689 RepID=A0A640KP90_LEITA|nr:hypothetical protein, conserved [Leishmania tarentolae]
MRKCFPARPAPLREGDLLSFIGTLPHLPPRLVLRHQVLLHAVHVRPQLWLAVLQRRFSCFHIMVVHHDCMCFKATEEDVRLHLALLARRGKVLRQSFDELLACRWHLLCHR